MKRYFLLLLLLSACGSKPEAPAVAGPTLPTQPVEILVDDMGVPHIYAENDADLYFAYGYQLASDRMLQLDMFRRFAHGRLCEVFGAAGPGSAGDNSLVDDRFARIFNWKHWGKLDADWMKENEPEDYTLTSAWVAGINQRVAEIRRGAVPAPLGFEELDFLPESWSQDDPYIVQKMVGFGLDQTIQYEVFVTFSKQFAPDALEAIQLFKPARPTYVLPEEDRPASSSASPGAAQLRSAPSWLGAQQPFGSTPNAAGLERLGNMKALGSNNWAVDGRHTQSGMPLMAGDPHLGYGFSGVTYAVQLNSTRGSGTFDVAGFAFAGVPGIFAGHNNKVAWTETSSFADVMDMWAVTVEDGKANLGGVLVDVVEREEVITIRDAAEPELLTVIDVPGYGVIMPSALVGSPLPIAGAGKEVLIGWTGFKARPARYFRELNRVQSLDEFEQAVLRMPEMSYNFMAADATGISYRVGVDVPKRNPLGEGREPFWTMDATDAQSFWPGGIVDKDLMPHSRAEQRGWLASANNDPFGFTDDGRVDNDPFYYGALFPPGWRAMRIEGELERLVSEGGVTREAMQQLQLDTNSNLADDLMPVVEQAVASVQTDPALAAFKDRDDIATLVALLSDWDRKMTRDSAGALAFHAFAHLAAQATISDDLSPVLFQIVLNTAPMYMLKITALALAGQYPDGDLVMQEGRDVIVLTALGQTADLLTERFGGVEAGRYKFSDMRVSDMNHAFGRGVELPSVPTDGGESTVNVAQSKFLDDGAVAATWSSNWGPIERQVTDFDANGVPESYVNFALGNVADPNGGHFDDQLDGWVNGTYRKLLYERGEVEAAVETRIELPAVE